MRRSQIIMGTGVSIDIPGAKEAVFEAAFKELKEIDKKFSTYKPDSELSRFQRGELTSSQLSNDFKLIQKASVQAEMQTGGFFSAYFRKQYDPTGYVKGWAIARVGKLIRAAGYETFCIGIGGDILAASKGDKIWKIGLQDPSQEKYLTSQVFLKNGAIATSGNYERGKHIINPKTGELADELLSISVAGPDIITADVLATACFAAGRKWQGLLTGWHGYEGLSVELDGRAITTAGFGRYLTRNQEKNRS